jgi:hypothetical protein
LGGKKGANDNIGRVVFFDVFAASAGAPGSSTVACGIYGCYMAQDDRRLEWRFYLTANDERAARKIGNRVEAELG